MPRSAAQTPPATMTWAKAAPVILISIICDAARIFFSAFWLFGPALGALLCTVEANSIVESATAGLLGTKTAAALCSAVAVKAGVALSPALVLFGTIMAMAVGLFGWLLIGLLLITTNARIFRENAGHLLLFLFGFGASTVPIINALPFLTVTTVRLYHTQIRKERAQLQQWRQQHVSTERAERDSQIAEISRLQQERAVADAQAVQALEMEDSPDAMREAA